jgi:hypothetical protein
LHIISPQDGNNKKNEDKTVWLSKFNPTNNVLEMKTLKWQNGDNIDTHNSCKWYDIESSKLAKLVELN